MANIKSYCVHSTAWVLSALMLYSIVLRSTVQSPSWVARFFGLVLLLVLPWMACNTLAMVFNASLHPSWMLAPLLLTVIAPAVEP